MEIVQNHAFVIYFWYCGQDAGKYFFVVLKKKFFFLFFAQHGENMKYTLAICTNKQLTDGFVGVGAESSKKFT